MSENKDLLLELYGSNSFVKVYQALEIDKIKFSFAKKGEEKNGIDVYMDAEELSSDLMRLIRNDDVAGQGIDSLWRRICRERTRVTQTGDKYCKPIWTSKISKGKDGTIRSFSIMPGSSTEIVISASANEKKILVGCEYRELQLFRYKWSFLEHDYEKKLAEKYTIKNMKRVFNPENNSAGENSSKASSSAAAAHTSSSEAKSAGNADKTQITQQKPLGYSSNSRKTNADARPVEPQTPVMRDTDMNAITVKVKVILGLTQMASGSQAMKAISEHGETYNIIFTKDIIAKTRNWTDIEAKCSCKGTIINIKGFIKDDRILVQSVA